MSVRVISPKLILVIKISNEIFLKNAQILKGPQEKIFSTIMKQTGAVNYRI